MRWDHHLNDFLAIAEGRKMAAGIDKYLQANRSAKKAVSRTGLVSYLHRVQMIWQVQKQLVFSNLLFLFRKYLPDYIIASKENLRIVNRNA